MTLKGSLCFGEEDFRALVQNSWRGSNQMGTNVLKVVQDPAERESIFQGSLVGKFILPWKEMLAWNESGMQQQD